MSVETGRKHEGLDLELIKDQWASARVSFNHLVFRLGSTEAAAKYLTDFVSPLDLTLEGYQRAVHSAAFNDPEDMDIADASVIATSLITCAQTSRAIEALIPHRSNPDDATAQRLFKLDLVRSLYMVDQTVAELKGFGQSSESFGQLANIKPSEL